MHTWTQSTSSSFFGKCQWVANERLNAVVAVKRPVKTIFPFLGVVRTVMPFACGSVARSRVKHLEKKLTSENDDIGASSGKMGKCDVSRRFALWPVWILMNYSGVRNFPQFSPKLTEHFTKKSRLVKDDHSPDAWKSGLWKLSRQRKSVSDKWLKPDKMQRQKLSCFSAWTFQEPCWKSILLSQMFESCNWVHGQTLLGKHCSRPWRSSAFLSVFAECCFVSFSDYM